MSESNHLVTVTIFDRDYKIKCHLDEAQALQEAAKILDQQMRSNHPSTTGINTERLAVITALNLSHELAKLRQQISKLSNKIRTALVTEEEIAV